MLFEGFGPVWSPPKINRIGLSQLLVIFYLFETKISCPKFVSWLRSSNTLKNWKKMVRGAPPPRGSFLGSSGVCRKNFKILALLEGGEKNCQSSNTKKLSELRIFMLILRKKLTFDIEVKENKHLVELFSFWLWCWMFETIWHRM